MSEKITPKTFPKYIPNLLLKDLPEFLKDPLNYNKIQKALLNTLAGQHSHSEMVTWANCINCQNKMRNHAELMRKFGFKTPQQYMAWKKIIASMINKKRASIR